MSVRNVIYADDPSSFAIYTGECNKIENKNYKKTVDAKVSAR